MAIMRARTTRSAGRKRIGARPLKKAHRRSGAAPRVMMQKLAYVSCVRANTDPEGENHESGTGVFLIGRGTSTGCEGRPYVGGKHPRIIPCSLHVTIGNGEAPNSSIIDDC